MDQYSLVIRRDDQSTKSGNVFCMRHSCATFRRQKHDHDRAAAFSIHSGYGPAGRTARHSLRSFFGVLLRLKYDQSSDQLAGAYCRRPTIRHSPAAQLILIPAFALRAVKPRYSIASALVKLIWILESAIWKCASPLNLTSTASAEKRISSLLLSCAAFLQRPFTTDEMQVQPRDSVGADATAAHYSQNVRSRIRTTHSGRNGLVLDQAS